ncbi:hypothetical protein [Neisseria sicca]|nr:hypothetical protein [Neisseria sicca]
MVFRGQSPRYSWIVDGTCGLFEHMKKGRLKAGFWVFRRRFYLGF